MDCVYINTWTNILCLDVFICNLMSKERVRIKVEKNNRLFELMGRLIKLNILGIVMFIFKNY